MLQCNSRVRCEYVSSKSCYFLFSVLLQQIEDLKVEVAKYKALCSAATIEEQKLKEMMAVLTARSCLDSVFELITEGVMVLPIPIVCKKYTTTKSTCYAFLTVLWYSLPLHRLYKVASQTFLCFYCIFSLPEKDNIMQYATQVEFNGSSVKMT